MVDPELVDLGELDAVLRTHPQNVLRELLMHVAAIGRQVHDLGFIPERPLGDRTRTHREGRQVIEEKIVEMVVGHHDDGIGCRLGEALAKNAERLFEFGEVLFVGIVAVPENPRIMGRRDDARDFRHAPSSTPRPEAGCNSRTSYWAGPGSWEPLP